MTLAIEALVQVAESWSLDLTKLSDSSIEGFYKLLVEKVEALWRADPEKLMNTLYRLDVAEEKVKAAVKAPKRGSTAADLAQLIIEREIEKAITRKNYQR